MARRKKHKAGDLEKAQEYCTGCLKYDPDTGECEAFTELFHLWSDGECWAREERIYKWKETLESIVKYAREKDPEVRHKVNRRAVNRLKKMELEVYRDIYAAYLEELKRGEKGGGGEKADRTNKTFGPQQMKDNRFPHRKNPEFFKKLERDIEKGRKRF